MSIFSKNKLSNNKVILNTNKNLDISSCWSSLNRFCDKLVKCLYNDVYFRSRIRCNGVMLSKLNSMFKSGNIKFCLLIWLLKNCIAFVKAYRLNYILSKYK